MLLKHYNAFQSRLEYDSNLPEVSVRLIEEALRKVEASPTEADQALMPHAPRAQHDKRAISSLST